MNRIVRNPAPIAALLMTALTAACSGDNPAGTQTAAEDADQPPASAQVTGTLSYRERMLLKPGSVVEVRLLDTSRADAPATEIAYQRIDNPGPPPISFVLDYDPASIRENMQYSVRAEIKVGDTLIYTTDTHYPVLTRGAGSEVDLVLKRVAPAPGEADVSPKPDASLTNTYWKLTSIDGAPYRHEGQQREPHLQLRDGDLTVSGQGGCNAFTGSYETYAESLRFGLLAATQMACLDNMETEARFLAALDTVDRYAITGDHLDLYSGDEAILGFDAVYF